MRSFWLLPAFALLGTGCIVEAPTGQNKPPPEVERARAQARDMPPMVVRLSADLDGKAELTAASVQPGQVAPGESAKVTLVFKALEDMTADYTIFVHVEDVDGHAERMNLDHKPVGGQYPTNRWKKGELIKDEFTLFVPPVAVRGLNLWMGLWDAATDTRLRLRNPDKVRNDGNNRILVMQVPVTR